MTASVLAIAALAFIAWSYVLFPLLMLVRGRLCVRPWKTDGITPDVSMIVVCHNEVASIGDKLWNLLELNYPRDRLEVIVASDGSDDGMDDVVRAFDDDRVVLQTYPRRGKIPALNDAVATARGEVLVFSDANSMFSADSIRNLVRHFADSTIGCVAGNQVYSNDPAGDASAGAAAAGEKTYWNFDRLLKQAASRAGNAISATGAIYAIRRALYCKVPSGVTDDFTVSTRTISQGYRLIFEPAAIATERVAGKPRAEFRRKVRVMTRGLRAVLTVRELLNPFRYGFYSLQLFSHKVMRRLVVFPLVFLLGLSPWLWDGGWWWQLLVTGQLTVYGLGCIGWACSRTLLASWRPLSIPFYFGLINVAAFMAVMNVLCGRKIERWETHRATTGSGAASLENSTA